jgi:hypothetical protein
VLCSAILAYLNCVLPHVSLSAYRNALLEAYQLVARRVDEQYPDFYASFVTILPHFDWQIELLEEWMKDHPYIKKQGGAFIADGLSKADKEWLYCYLIAYEPVSYTVNVD